MPEDTQPFPRIPYAINKGAQLNAITSEVLTEMNVGKFDLKTVLSGYMDDCEWPEEAGGNREEARLMHPSGPLAP